MKLSVKTAKHHFRFHLPLRFMKILFLDEKNGPLYRELYYAIRKECQKYKGMVLVEAIDKDGTRMKITL